MKITKLSLSISVLSLLAVLSSAQANETILNCAQVSAGQSDKPNSGPSKPIESCAEVVIPIDYGDAPPTLPTDKVDNGARHQLGTNVYLGQCVDADLGAVKGNATATHDDEQSSSYVFGTCAKAGDDEDGVSVTDLVVGGDSTVTVVANAACQLNAWMDWDGNKSWEGAGEHIFINQALNQGTNTLTLNVPKSAKIDDIYARFRCSTKGNDNFNGDADDGEVEDYRLTVQAATKVPLSIGDFVWIDSDKDGQQDKTEYGLVDATVTLLLEDGTAARDLDGKAVAPQTIKADGKYLFNNLPDGNYIVRIQPPAGYVPTKGGIDPNTDPSNTDSNCKVTDKGIQTAPFALLAGKQPDTAADGDDTNGNMTVDCGFYKTQYSVGNQVWVDDGAGIEANADNGKFDTGESPAPDGVVVELYDASGIQRLQQTTTNKGFYVFGGLDKGDYKICLAAKNFAADGKLEGYIASTGGDELDANLDVDGNDNGSNTTSKEGVCSSLVTLGDNEPTGELPTINGQAGYDGINSDDNRSNLTVDFGVISPKPQPDTLTLGDYMWIDRDANGLQEKGELGLNGVTVNLMTTDGKPVTNASGKPVGPQTTNSQGLYSFGDLSPGEYVVKIQPPNGYFLTMGGVDIDDDSSNTDSNCIVDASGTIKTHPLSLNTGSEPDTQIDGDDKNGNLTADCGFYRTVSVGDTIWNDKNANGNQDSDEPGISNVLVEITGPDGLSPVFDVHGHQVQPIKTDASGKYRFDDLPPGTYTISVTPGEKGYTVSPGGYDPDTNTSDKDNNCLAVNGGFQTLAFNVFDTDGTNTVFNQTIDCGFYRPVGVGSHIWIDIDGDGKRDSGEPGVPNAVVTLLTPDGKPATNIHGQPVPPQTTDAKGEYFFGNLREGEYVIAVQPPQGYLPTVYVEDPNNDNPYDSNGSIIAGNGTVASMPIKLVWGEEPDLGDGDKSKNTTVSFGFVSTQGVQIPTLSQWGLGLLTLLMSGLAFLRRRRMR